MKKSICILLIIAVCLLLIGMMLIGVGFLLGGNLDREQTQTVTHEIQEPFTDITMRGGAVNFIIARSGTGTNYAVCDQSDKITYEVTVQDGSLYIQEKSTRRWWDYIGIFIGNKTVILYLTETAYGTLQMNTASGEILCEVSDLTFSQATLHVASGDITFASGVTGDLQIECGSGDVEVKNTAPHNVSVHTGSGEIELEHMQAKGTVTLQSGSGEISLERVQIAASLSLKNGSGDVSLEDVTAHTMILETGSGNMVLERCDGKELNLQTGSGNIEASLRSGKQFDVHSGSGKTVFPAPDPSGGTCTAKAGSGNIRIAVVP